VSSLRTLRLSDVLHISSERIEPMEFPDSSFNYIGLENIEGHTGRLVKQTRTPGSQIQSTKNVFRERQILYGKLRPYLNKVYLADEDGICSTDIFVLTCNEKHILPEFAAYYLRSERALEMVQNLTVGANLPRVDAKGFLSIDIPVPSLSEQKKIIRIIDAAESIVDLRGKVIARTDQVGRALFHQILSDASKVENVPLGELLLRIESGWSPVCHDEPADSDQWGVLRLGAVTTGRFIESDNKGLRAEETPRPQLEVRSGDVLFTRKNTKDLVAAIAYVWETRPKLMMSDLIFRLVPADLARLNPIYLAYALSDPIKRKEIQSLASGAAGSMPNISKDSLMRVRLPMISPDLQFSFAEHMRKVRQLIVIQEDSRQRLKDLCQSSLNRAFLGAL
jgi:type I restriction enzyme, S subunit